MALSNWDQIVIKMEKGVKPVHSHGVIYDTYGYGLEIYKNWVYLHDSNLQPETERPFVGDTVGQFNSGDIRWGTWQINVIRGPQEGVYVVAESYTKDTSIVGCGVYGYVDYIELYTDYIQERGFRLEEVNEVSISGKRYIQRFSDGFLIMEIPKETEYVGVLPESVEFLKQHASSYKIMLPDEIMNYVA